MDDQQGEPSGPPLVTKGTKISIQGTESESTVAKAGGKKIAVADSAGSASVDTSNPLEDTAMESSTEPPVSRGVDAPSNESSREGQSDSMEDAIPADVPADNTEQNLPPKTAIDNDLAAIDMADEGSSTVPTKSPKTKKQGKGGGKKFLIILLVILLLAAAGFGIYTFLKKPAESKSTTGNTVPTSNNSNGSNQQTTQPETVTIKTFKSTTIGVELSYPSNWKTNENGNQVVFTSPEISYVKKDGSTTKGSFRLIVQKGYTQTDSTTINNSVAVKTSELIQYTAPAPGQRTSSYLSYLGKDKQTFNFIMITSGKQYNPGDTVAATLPLTQDSYIIVGGYGKGNGENIDFDAISPDKIQQNAVYNQAVDIIKSLKITS